MIDLLEVFDCPNCGKILSDQVVGSAVVDCENDDVFDVFLCRKCGHEVKPQIIDGLTCFEKVDHDRWLWASGYYDEKPEEGG